MNPFKEKPMNLINGFRNWKQLYPKPYDKFKVDPYTKARIILMNGTEFEANWFSHNFARHTTNNDLRRELALTRSIEKQQQISLSLLKPDNESILEHTISYEQLAVDLTAELAKRETDCYVKKALDFALLEDFDHLYRFSNLLEMEQGIKAEKLVGRYTEIMPARPTISHHRCPNDSVRFHIDKNSPLLTKLHVNIITAAEQQTMNFYMNICNLYPSDLGRRLYQEIGMVEEQHVTHYGSLMNTNMSWYENLLLHMYTMCYLYYSCMQDETNEYIKKVWEEGYIRSVAGLHIAAYLLRQYGNMEPCEVIPDGRFPRLLTLGPNIEYVREILKCTVDYTALREEYVPVQSLQPHADFFKYQGIVNKYVECVPSHNVIEKRICNKGIDYRFEVAPNPIYELQNRHQDNITVGRTWHCHRYSNPKSENEEKKE